MYSAIRRFAAHVSRALRGTAVSDLSAKPWARTIVPEHVRRIPAFLSPEEERYLVWLGEHVEGWGAVVDLGAWVGGSSACIADGLRRSGRKTKIQSFDRFQWEAASMGPASGRELAEGADFLPMFEHNVRDYRAWIEPRRADLLAFRWDEGPIEVLFVDAAKSWELLNAILAGFGDSVVPGRTRVVFQDYRYHVTHWLPLVVGTRPDLWSEVEAVDDGSTVTFRTLRALRGPGGIDADYADEMFSFEQAEAVLRERMQRENSANRVLLLRTLYRKALIELAPERCRTLREELFAAEGGPTDPVILASIEEMEWPLSREPWLAYERGDVARARRLAEERISRRGDLSPLRQLLGRICLNAGELAAADEHLTCVVETSRETAHALLDRAECRRRMGRLAEAERDAIAAVEASGGKEAGIEHAVWVLDAVWLAAGRPDHGLAVLQELVSGNENSGSIWAQLGRVENRLGRREAAVAHCERASALAPNGVNTARCRAELGAAPGAP